MPVTILAMTTVNPNGQDALETYLSVTGPLLEKAGAKLVSRNEVAEAIIGERPAQFMTLIEYPNRDAVAGVFESESYQSLRSVRDKAFTHYDICILSE